MMTYLGGAVQTFQYRPGYNNVQFAGMALAAIVLAAIWWSSGNSTNLILSFFLVAFAIVGSVGKNGGGIALAFDDKSVTVRSGAGLKTFAWGEVTSIYLQKRNASSVLTIPFGGTLFICFETTRDSLFENRVWLSTNTMELPPNGPGALLEMLNRTWEASKKIAPSNQAHRKSA